MLTTIYFVRHAHSTYTPEELARPLSERGLLDAIKVSHILEKENVDIVISSPYKRAIQTIDGVAKHIGKDIVLEEDFKERSLSENPVDDFGLAITKVWEEPTFAWEGGESNIMAQKRGIQASLRVLDKYEGKRIAIGTHGNIMVLIMNYFDHKYDFSFWKELEMPDIYKLTFDKHNLIDVKRLWNR
ncbi:histidine phosphatase family protein [Bacillus sp. DJP31]|uniref:histidine phosphatase family protein n=1 Tax=Bacillus sp. DJP31 TaxID=3409789 RepID=UPI003BB6F14F